MKNYSGIMRVGSYMRLLEPVFKHFTRADDQSVKDALDVMKFRQDTGGRWKDNRDTRFSAGIPEAMFFHPKFSKLGLETMSEEEKKSFMAAWKKSAPKLSV